MVYGTKNAKKCYKLIHMIWGIIKKVQAQNELKFELKSQTASIDPEGKMKVSKIQSIVACALLASIWVLFATAPASAKIITMRNLHQSKSYYIDHEE